MKIIIDTSKEKNFLNAFFNKVLWKIIFKYGIENSMNDIYKKCNVLERFFLKMLKLKYKKRG
jgi:hypothetical protein